MISKLVVWGKDRDQALGRLRSQLTKYNVRRAERENRAMPPRASASAHQASALCLPWCAPFPPPDYGPPDEH